MALTALAALPPTRALAAKTALEGIDSEVRRIAREAAPYVTSVEVWSAEQPVSVGAGVVVDPSGLVVTTSSVARAGDHVVVRNAALGVRRARVLGLDPLTNLAVLQVEGEGAFQAARLARAGEAGPGSWVVIIGNSYGAGGTVSVGIVGGHRGGPSSPEDEGLLQVNAAVNPGDSGAPIFNAKGELIGILCAAVTSTTGSVSGGLVGGGGAAWGNGSTVGFAIPIGSVRFVVSQLRENRRVIRGFLGIQIRPLDPGEAPGVPRPALLITEVLPASPADACGLRQKDLILAVNGIRVSSPREFQRLVTFSRPDESLRLQVSREKGVREIAAIVGEMPVTFAKQKLGPSTLEGAVPPSGPPSAGAAALRSRISEMERTLDSLRAELASPGIAKPR